MSLVELENERKALRAKGLSNVLCGITVKADHPITCCNPEETFEVKEAKIEDGNLYLRGEKTMWFSVGLLTRIAT